MKVWLSPPIVTTNHFIKRSYQNEVTFLIESKPESELHGSNGNGRHLKDGGTGVGLLTFYVNNRPLPSGDPSESDKCPVHLACTEWMVG